MIFLDESGINLALTRLYARAPRGERAVGSVPQSYGQNYTVLAALDRSGIRAAMLVAGAANGAVFLTFVKKVLAPKLRRRDIVVLDNLPVHKVAGVAEAIEAVGAELRYLPPYSPDYNPTEKVWSKMKAELRGMGARTQRKLTRCLSAALEHITKHDAQAWFKHCGYGLH